MKRFKQKFINGSFNSKTKSEKGAALVIVIFVLLLLLGFVAVVLSRVNTETVLTANDAAENRTFAASEAQIESDSRDFVNLFLRKLSPPVSDIDIIRNSTIAGFPDYDLTGKTITQTKASEAFEIQSGQYAGLYSLRDEWEFKVPAIDRNSQVQTTLKRSFINDRIPLFQFGMFYEDDLELNRPPLFTFGGRVHTNSNLFITANKVNSNPVAGIYFNSKTTVVGEIVNDIWKMGTALATGTDDQNGAFFADTAGTYRELLTGNASVNCRTPSGANVFAAKPNLPNCSARTNWDNAPSPTPNDKAQFQGNLDNHKPRLDLPLYRLGVNLTELIKRGKNTGDVVKNSANTVAAVNGATQDSAAISYERFANKQGLRISLADAQNKLPGCSGAVANANFNECGIQLDRQATGYLPKAMQDGYQATRLNTTRFAQNGKQMWIKVEIVDFDYDNGVPVTRDITEDFLSLGVTERAPISNTFQIFGYGAATLADSDPAKTDARSIIKLQRFAISGPQITNAGGTSYLSYDAANQQNFVRRYTTLVNPPGGCAPVTGIAVANSFSAPLPRPSMNSGNEDAAHLKCFGFTNTGVYTDSIVPFPIEMFDTREGIAQDRPAVNNGINGTDSFGADNIPLAGVMSMINIDVANLRKFLNGTAGAGNSFNGSFPTTTPFAIAKGAGMSLNSADIPQNKGWVLYVSDRRGDADFDGEYDMEDTLPDGAMEFNEDVNGVNFTTDVNGVKTFDVGNGTFDVLYYSNNNNFFEAPQYSDTTTKSQGATADHGYFRRGVRLINGSILPGIYDRLSPTTTRGFTLASENGVYVQGNYNATSVTLSGTNAPAAATNYFPQGGTLTVAGSANATQHIPAAIVSDATTILSNAWNDAESFATPFAQENRVATATQIRFALLTGDTVTGKNGTTNISPSATGGLGNGGVHNFKRFLEQWTGVRLNYTGSLVNLFNSRNNNAAFKCCEAVYNPPVRDWSFDTTFIDPNRLPPGTPYIYSTTLTGFERVDY